MAKNAPPRLHHILPRFLLEGFASWKRKTEARTWVIPKSRSAYEANIRKVSIEQYFYGRGSGSAEDLLAQLEDRAAPVIVRLRTGARVSVSDYAVLSEFVSTLIVRTRHLRDEVQNALTRVGNEFADGLDSDSAKALVVDYLRNNPDALSAQVRQALGLAEGTSLPNGLLEQLRAHLDATPGSALINPAYIAGVRHGLKHALGSIDAGEHQIRALRLSLEDTSATGRFANFAWSVVRGADRLVLSDTGPIAQDSEGALHSPLTLGPRCSAVLLPLSPTTLLVAHSGAVPALPEWAAIVRKTAELSSEYCVAASRDEDQRHLASLIGAQSQLLSAADATELVADTWKKITKQRDA